MNENGEATPEILGIGWVVVHHHQKLAISSNNNSKTPTQVRAGWPPHRENREFGC